MRQTSTSSGSASRSSGSFWQGRDRGRRRDRRRHRRVRGVLGFVALAAWALWRREAQVFSGRPATRAEVREALRYGLPGPPAALLAQAVFWADLWVLAAFEQGTTSTPTRRRRGSAGLVFFLTSLNLVFSPFAADLHARGERERLGELFKRSTRWALAATLPLLIILFVAADDVLEAFSSRFDVGEERASNPPRRPGRERRDRRGGLHPDHDRVYRRSTWSTTRSAWGCSSPWRSRSQPPSGWTAPPWRRRSAFPAQPRAPAGPPPDRHPAVRPRLSRARPPRRSGCARGAGLHAALDAVVRVSRLP